MAKRLQKAAEYRRLLKPLFPPIKRLMLCLIFGSCILPQTWWDLWGARGAQWVGIRALSGPKPKSKNSVSGSAAAMAFIISAPRGSMPWGPRGLHQPLLLSLHIPGLAKCCPEKQNRVVSHELSRPRGSHCGALVTRAQFSQKVSASSSQRWLDTRGCPQLWFGWRCLLHAVHTDNLD